MQCRVSMVSSDTVQARCSSNRRWEIRPRRNVWMWRRGEEPAWITGRYWKRNKTTLGIWFLRHNLSCIQATMSETHYSQFSEMRRWGEEVRRGDEEVRWGGGMEERTGGGEEGKWGGESGNNGNYLQWWDTSGYKWHHTSVSWISDYRSLRQQIKSKYDI